MLLLAVRSSRGIVFPDLDTTPPPPFWSLSQAQNGALGYSSLPVSAGGRRGHATRTRLPVKQPFRETSEELRGSVGIPEREAQNKRAVSAGGGREGKVWGGLTLSIG